MHAESPEPESVETNEGLDEETAATVLQSNFRGHRERKRLKEHREQAKEKPEDDPLSRTVEDEEMVLDVSDIIIEQKDGEDATKQDEEEAAVKIQSNFRGYKDRKKLKADKQSAQDQAEQLGSFSKEIAQTSEDFVVLQLKLNEIIEAHQSNPENNGMFVRGKAVNGYAPQQSQSPEKRLSRTPRRTQQPKTLNTPEDCTYYTLIHRSVQDDKRKPRKKDPGKLLDVDDQYYQCLPTSRSSSISTIEETDRHTVEGTDRRPSMNGRLPSSRPTRARAVTEPEPPRPPRDVSVRRSMSRVSSTDSRTEDNPYDFRHLLRKTSQRRKLIKHY